MAKGKTSPNETPCRVAVRGTFLQVRDAREDRLR